MVESSEHRFTLIKNLDPQITLIKLNTIKIKVKKFKIIISIWLILIITFVAFFPSLKNEFTNWDDNEYVTENADIQNLSGRNIKKIFSSFYTGIYCPLTVLSYSVEYHFFKLNPYVYHSTNLNLHLLNTALVFWLIYLLSGKVLVSLIASLLFGIHPLHVEPVAWVTGRKDVLYSFFFLSAIISYLYYRKKQVVNYYFLSLGLFIFSCLAKGVAMILPFVLLLCDYLLGRKFDWSSVKEKIPYIGIGVLFGIVATLGQFSDRKITMGFPITFFLNILIASYGLLFYLTKMLVPIKLSSVYPFPEELKISMFPPVFLFLFIIIVALIAVVIFSGKYSRKIIYGSLFFLVTILPVSQLIPRLGTAIAADRFTYIPSIGIFYLLGEGFSLFYETKLKHNKVTTSFLLIVLLGVIGTLSFLTYQRCGVWKDNIILWSDVLKKYPTNVPIAYNNRGNAYDDKEEYNQAISDYNQALKIEPDYADAYFNRGNTYYKKGEYEQALSDYNQVLNIDPNYAKVYTNRGNVYKDKKEYNQAISDYNQALEINPSDVKAYNNRGLAYYENGEYDKAISDYNQALRINPDYADVYYHRGNIYYQKGEYDKAISDYNQALRINPDYAEVYNNRGIIYYEKREYEQALSDYNQALKTDPNYAKAYNNRGLTYYQKGEYDQAISDYNQAIKINPNSAEAYYNRALVYLRIGKYDSARENILKMQTLGYQINSHFFDLSR